MRANSDLSETLATFLQTYYPVSVPNPNIGNSHAHSQHNSVAPWFPTVVELHLADPHPSPVTKTPWPAPSHSWAHHRFNPPKPAWVRNEIIRLKAQGPGMGCRHIALIFNRRHAAEGMSVGKTFVNSVIRQQHYEIQCARRALRQRRLRPGPKNRIWGLDLTGKTDKQGRLHAILGVLDHGTRANLLLTTMPNKSTASLLRAIAVCVERFGRPRTLRTDNEAMFRSKLFRFALWLAGIRHQRIEPPLPLAEWANRAVLRHLEGKTRPVGHRGLRRAGRFLSGIPALV